MAWTKAWTSARESNSNSNNRKKRATKKFEDITDQVNIKKGSLPLKDIVAQQIVVEWVGVDENDDAVLVIAHENLDHPGMYHG